jgi:hypothetical protein
MIPPAVRNASSSMCSAAEQLLAEQREDQQDRPGDQARLERHRALLRRARAGGQPGVDRRAARRVDHHEQRDEGREEQLDHGGRYPAATSLSRTSSIAPRAHQHAEGARAVGRVS